MYALLSVYDKTGLLELANYLTDKSYNIISTGGTAAYLKENDIPIIHIEDYTHFPEILNGRVKTLNPMIYGGILNVRTNNNHQKEIKNLNIKNIDLVVVNLYLFEETIKTASNDVNKCLENIDIGGVSLLRAAAKNYQDVYVLSNPNQYEDFILNKSNAHELALSAFMVTSYYDTIISDWFSGEKCINKKYIELKKLKYGCNPYQDSASLLTCSNDTIPFTILNGEPGYINILDALNAWCLVAEIKESLNMDAAASFKHTSPAGVALGTPLSDFEQSYYNIDNVSLSNLSPAAIAYLRARNCDPKSSFGDFISINTTVDVSLANIIKNVVSDGIIAYDFDSEALEILKQKKKGRFIILKGNKEIIHNNNIEYREFKNCVLSQRSNNTIINRNDIKNIVTNNKELPETIIQNMIMSLITLKYTQSNSVGYAYENQMIGIGAGQQSRIDCVLLAKLKAKTWFLRRHPKILDFKFVDKIKKQDKVNAIISYIENDFTDIEYNRWSQLFDSVPEPLSLDEINNYIKEQTNVLLASDAFFPYRDSIDKASQIGVKYVVQPGGSIADKSVITACNEYNMVMVNSNIRLFHH